MKRSNPLNRTTPPRRARWVALVLLALLLIGVSPREARSNDFEWEGRLKAVEVLLQSEAEEEREAAARQLGTFPPHQSEPLLKKALSDHSPVVQAAALDAVARAGAVGLEGEVVARLNASRAPVRAAAASVLGRLHARGALEPLMIALSDPSAEVRIASIEALGRIRDGRSALALASMLSDPRREVVAVAIEELARFKADPNVVYTILDKTHDTSITIKSAAVEALGELKDLRATPALVNLIHKESLEIQRAALLALARVRDPAAVEPLLMLLNPESQVESLTPDVILTLGKIGDPRAVEPLLRLLDQHRYPDSMVISAIADIGTRATEQVMDALALESDPQRQRRLLRVLARIPDERVYAFLAKSLRGERFARVDLLDAISEQFQRRSPMGGGQRLAEVDMGLISEHLTLTLEQLSNEEMLRLLLRFESFADARLVEPLLDHYKNAPKPLRMVILGIFARLGPEAIGASSLVIAELGAKDLELRDRAISTAAQLRDPAAVQALGVLLRGEDRDARGLAATALGTIGGPAAIALLFETAKDRTHPTRRLAMWALSLATRTTPSEDVEEYALEVLEDPNNMLAFSALDVLETMQTRALDPQLASLYAEGRISIKFKVVELIGFARLGSAGEIVKEALSSPYEAVRAEACWVAGVLEQRDAVEVLVERLHDPSVLVSINAAASLGRIGVASEEVLAALHSRLFSRNPHLQNNALWALAELERFPNDWLAEAIAVQTDNPFVRETLYRVLLAQGEDSELFKRLFEYEEDPIVRRVIAQRQGGGFDSRGYESWYLIELVTKTQRIQPTIDNPTYLYLPDASFKATRSDENGKVRIELAEPGPLRTAFDLAVLHTEHW